MEQFQFQDFSNGDQVQAAKEAADAAPRPTFSEAWTPAVRTEWTVDGAIKQYVGSQFVVDPNYRLPQGDAWKELTKDIPAHMHGAFASATSEAHANTIRYNITQEIADRKVQADARGGAAWAPMAAAVSDPIQLMLSIGTGGIGTSTKAGRLANFFKAGLAAGGSNVAVEAYLAQQQATRDPHDIATAGLFGFALGGAIGSLTKQESKIVQNLGHEGGLKRQLDGIKQEGDDLSPKVGMVRVYHGGQTPDGSPRWVSPDQKYAEGYAAKSGGGVFYVDIPENSPLLKKAFDDSGASTKAPYVAFELPAGLSKQFKPLPDGVGLTPKGRALDEATAPHVEEVQGKVMPAHVAAAVEDAKFQKQLREDFRTGIKGAIDEVMNDSFPLRGQPLPKRAADPLPPVGSVATPEELVQAGSAAKRASLDHQAVADYQSQVEELLNPKVVPTGPAIDAPTKADTIALNAYRKVAGEGKQPTALELAFAKANVTKAAETMRGDIKAKLKEGKVSAQADAEAAAKLRDAQTPKEADPLTVQRQAEHDAALAQREQQKMDELLNSEQTPGTAAHELGLNPGETVYWKNKAGEDRSGVIKEVDRTNGYLKVVDEETGRTVKVPLENLDMADSNGGMGFLPGSVGSAQALPVPQTKSAFVDLRIPGTNLVIPLRWSYFAIFNRSKNSQVQRLGEDLLEDAVGREGGGHVAITASAYAELERGTYRGRFYTTARDAFAEFVKDTGVPILGRMKAENQFFEDVTRIVRGDLALSVGNPHAAKVAQEVRKIHDELLAKLKQHGVQGAEEVLPDASYMMRRFNHNKITGLIDNFGLEGVSQLVAHAIRSARFLPIEDALRIGRSYVRTVGMLQHTQQLGHAVFTLEDHAVLRDALKKHGVAPGDIEHVIEIMRGVGVDKGGDAGNMSRLKKRTGMDENYRMQLRGKDGKLQDVAISDMFENDSRMLMDIYTKQTTGHIGLARVGIKGSKDFQLRKDMISEESFAKAHNGEDTTKLLAYFDDVYNHIVGNPMSGEQFGKGQRIARFLRDINFTRMMGQAGFAQIAEIGNVIGLAGYRAASMHIPEMGHILEMAKGGLIPDQLSKDIMRIGGFGAEVAGSHPIGRELDEVMFDRTLSKAEQYAQTAKYYTAHVSGLHAVNNVLRQVTGRAFVQHYTDIALGITKRTAALDKRLATSGLDETNIDQVFDGIRKFVDVDKKADSKITGIRWEEWNAADPQGADLFRLATWREARRAVQEHTVGETAPWMHTTIGKILTQFRTFTLVANSKQLLHGLNHADMQTATAWALSMVFAGLAYTAQTSLNFAHNEAELNRRLTMENIAKSAFQRAGFSSLIPASIDTLASFTTGESVFSYGRTTGLGTGALVGNPTFDLVATKGLGTLQNATQSIFNDQHMWTKKDVKNGLGLVTPNLLLLRNFVDAASSSFPEKNYLKEPKPRQ